MPNAYSMSAKSVNGPPLTLKHSFTVGICAKDAHPGGPTSTPNGRPSLLGWLIATDSNEKLVAKHSSNGNVLRSNPKQLAQPVPGHSSSVAGNVCCAVSPCSAANADAGLVPAVAALAAPAAPSSCCGKEDAVVTAPLVGGAEAAMGERGFPWATWARAMRAATVIAKSMAVAGGASTVCLRREATVSCSLSLVVERFYTLAVRF